MAAEVVEFGLGDEEDGLLYFDDFGELSIEDYDYDLIDSPNYILEGKFYSPHGAFDDVFGNLPVESKWTL